MALLFWRLFGTRFLLVCVAVAALFVSTAGVAHAGFGITPPYVKNDRLTRGTVYEQHISLVRSDPTEDLKTEITLNVPGAESWISVDRGLEFILPKGQTQVPIVITVRVPENAEYKEYKGAIRVRTSSANVADSTGVSIALGAQIDVALKVVDKIFDFEVRKVRLIDLEEGRRKWGLFFPGKIRFFMTIKNTGNTEFGPTKVHFDIYDNAIETVLESVDNTNDIEQITPFTSKEVLAELPTRLPAGSYVAKYTIFKNDEVAQQGQLALSISSIGTVIGYEGYGFGGLSWQDKLKVACALGIPLILLLTLGSIVIMRRKRRKDAHVFRTR